MAISLTAARAPAQGAKILSKRTLSLWVQPQYGSDSSAAGAPWMNPRCTVGGVPGNGCFPLVECKPHDVVLTTGQVLLHAPWPFKTINQPGGALSYLPASLPDPGRGASWEYAVIHLLPGLYARADAYGPTPYTHNPDNGLRPNGEKFPIHLPPRVSIQGTSALNTVFDVSSPELDTAGPAFEFGTAGATGQYSFIDSIAIFGANTKWKGQRPPAKTFAGIAISNEIASTPTISNCFLYGNGIGVLVDAGIKGKDPAVDHHGTKLFNNTIAFNHVGLWNGQTVAGNSSIGTSKLILVNNIFDSSPESTAYVTYPTNWAYYGPSVPNNDNACFEGIDYSDLRVQGTTTVDSNAYELGRFNNVGVSHPLVNLPVTTHRTTTPPPTPAHNIIAYTGNNGARRGILYVRDALTKPTFATDTGNSQYFDQSPHDFRLSPAVAQTNNSPQAPNALNPLVNAGWGGSFPMTMANGLVVSNPPGFLPLGTSDQNSWAFHNWNWSGMGYGNPRVQNHGGFYGNSGGAWMDIGADELGQLRSVGYRFATTSFMSVSANSLPPGVNTMDNKYHWFFGPRSGPMGLVADPSNYSMPYFRAVNHLTGPPANYSPASWPAPWFSTWSFSNATAYYLPTVVDTTPHLLPDLHPWWTGLVFSPSNPIWQACGGALYNSYLYANPSVGRINPTGSYKGDGNNYQWLDLSWPTAPQAASLVLRFNLVVNFRSNPGSTVLLRYDAWGRGYDTGHPLSLVDTFKPTFAFGTPPVALRYCLENKGRPAFTTLLTDTNLQSFMVLVEEKQGKGK